MRDLLLLFALGYFSAILVGKRAERKRRAELAKLVANVMTAKWEPWTPAVAEYVNATTLEERAAAHQRYVASFRKAPNSGVIRCRHGLPIFECVDAVCVRMANRYQLGRPDDA